MQKGPWIFPLQGMDEIARLFAGENQYFKIGNLFRQE